VLKTPPASVLLKKAAGVAKGSAQLEKVGSITRDQLEVRARRMLRRRPGSESFLFSARAPAPVRSLTCASFFLPFFSQEIAKIKMPDLNAHKVESAMRVVAGTAANMGITIEGWDMEESKEILRQEKAATWGTA
jgi:large subunit ribosomal protein L11